MTEYEKLYRSFAGSFTIVGGLLLLSYVYFVASKTRMFLDPKFDNFWIDVQTFNLDQGGTKSLDELDSLYGYDEVDIYIPHKDVNSLKKERGKDYFLSMFIPSEEAAYTGLLFIMNSSGKHGSLDLNYLNYLFGVGVCLAVFYAPI